MIDTVVKLLPALLGIALRYVLRVRGVADRRDADFMFRLIINIFLPALAFTALSRVSTDRDLESAGGDTAVDVLELVMDSDTAWWP